MKVVEVLCHEITEADILKIQAISSHAGTGGGARDIRYPIRFKECLDRFFPSEATPDKKGVLFKAGSFIHFDGNGKRFTSELKYAPQPTDSRPNELRIAQTSKVEFLSDFPPRNDEDGRLFLTLIRFAEGPSQVQYLTERQIDDPRSNARIADAMHEAIESTRKNNAVIFSVELK